ncbi:hypothetical protein ACHAPU_001400 [Fusarium lateritium]
MSSEDVKEGAGRSRQTPFGSLISPESSKESENPLFPVISARYRTMTTSLPRLPFVLSFRTVLSDAAKSVERSIQHRVVEAVKHYQLADEDSYYVDVSMRETKGCPETAEPTVLIVLDSYPKEGHDAVVSMVKDLASFAHDELNKIDSSAPPFHIEVIDRRLVHPIHCRPVRERPDLLQSWDQIKGLVFQSLESHVGTKGHMTSIGLFRYGLSETSADNPITIFITVDFESYEVVWPKVIHDVEQQLAAHSFPALYVHVEHNIGYHLAPPPFELVTPGDHDEIAEKSQAGNGIIQGDYSTVVSLGDSIGPAKYVDGKDGSKKYPGTGTLGCYVEVKTAQFSQWEKYALTNYHVIRATLKGFSTGKSKGKMGPLPPPDRCDLRRVDEVGLAPGLHGYLSLMESPSRGKHNYTIWHAKKTLDDVNTKQQDVMGGNDDDAIKIAKVEMLDKVKAKTTADMDKKVDFFDRQNNILGKVYAASGFCNKTDENGRLDWALVKVNKSRIGTNQLPDEEVWKKTPIVPAPYFTFGAQLKAQGSSSIRLEHPNRCTKGYKLGTTSGATYGEFYEFKIGVNLLHDRYLGPILSDEYTFIQGDSGWDKPFAGPGDSGSVVFDSNGCAVGLLFRGLRPNNDNAVGHTYVTPIEHVFKGIKESSKGKIVDVRIAQ